MSQSTSTEPFPSFSSRQSGLSNHDHNSNHIKTNSNDNNDNISTAPNPQSEQPKRRRKSSNLPGEPRGDTGAAALSTMSDQTHRSTTVIRSASEKAARPFARGYKRRKAKTLLRRWKSFSLRHTWVNPLILCLILLSLYAINPTTDNPLHAAIFLSYPMPRKLGQDPNAPIMYAKGGKDFAFVAFYTIVLSFTREFLMQRVIRPLAVRAGIKSRTKQSRFMEQAYTAIYFGVFGPFGLYVMKRSPIWYFNTDMMYEAFPHKQHEGLFKAYYLLQAAYWSQQAVVLLLQLEKPRKDFKELVAHHIITIALIWLSYRFHFTYMGLAVYITHDVSDFFLATSKILNYLDHPFTAPYFGTFMFIWAYLRHYLNLRILYSVLTTFRTIGPFELNWDTQQYKCWISQYITFALLASLQAVNIFWFFLILRIAKRIVFDNITEDERSEAGTEEEADANGSPVETTKEKRERLGIAEPLEARMANGETIAPKVLLNGVPVEDTNGVVPVKSRGKNKASGVQRVEVVAQERRKVSR